jgi:hypothetical protein
MKRGSGHTTRVLVFCGRKRNPWSLTRAAEFYSSRAYLNLQQATGGLERKIERAARRFWSAGVASGWLIASRDVEVGLVELVPPVVGSIGRIERARFPS